MRHPLSGEVGAAGPAVSPILRQLRAPRAGARVSAVLLGACLLVPAAPAQNPCAAAWATGVFSQGWNALHSVRALAVFDDGTGPALYAGGGFGNGAGVPLGVARWNGTAWVSVGGGIAVTSGGVSGVHALAVFDDGSGPALYAGGSFTAAGSSSVSNIAKWNGTSWSAVGGGTDSVVSALAVFDDGSGPALHAGGWFTIAGGVPASRIARWNGTAWSSLGSGVSGSGGSGVSPHVQALKMADLGAGPALYAAGLFTSAGGGPAINVARWAGGSWSAVGGGLGVTAQSEAVWALEALDDGGGTRLHAAGSFTVAGGMPASRVARWDGSVWTQAGPSGLPDLTTSLAIADLGSGPALYAGGRFQAIQGGEEGVARWTGVDWAPVGQGIPTSGGTQPVSALLSMATPSGTTLVAGGSFAANPPAWAGGVAFFDGSAWTSPGGWVGQGLNGPVYDLEVFDDGSGPRLFASGQFTAAGGVTASRVARWNGVSWASLGSGIGGSGAVYSGGVYDLVGFDDGSGPGLFACGSFATAGGIPANGVARWDGTAWTSAGFPPGAPVGVSDLAAVDFGQGPVLCAGGGLGASPPWTFGVARRDQGAWSVFGIFDGIIGDLAAYDDGAGPALHVIGSFTTVNGMPASGIARFDGAAWSPLGTGLTGGAGGGGALAVWDDGAGAALYAGGGFLSAGGAPASRIARWDGLGWAPLGAGVDDVVQTLLGFDDGHGPALFAAGSFLHAGAVNVVRTARWDGVSWSSLSGGGPPSSLVTTMAGFDAGAGPQLHVGGAFSFIAGGGFSFNVARWDVPRPAIQTAPAPQTVAAGSTVSMSAAATGSGALTWQWRREGVPIPGATAPVLSLPAATPAQAGRYDVVVTDACARTTSPAAVIDVRRPEISLAQPAGPGSGVVVTDAWLTPGREYFNLFSLDLCATGPGTGPWLGLCFADPGFLAAQLLLPAGFLPIHFLPPGAAFSHPPVPLPPGLVVEGLCLDLTGGQPGSWSTVVRYGVQ